jgi:hypothetical protein
MQGSGNIFELTEIALDQRVDPVYALDLIEATGRRWGLAIRFLDGLGDTDITVPGFLHRWLT